MTLTQTSPQTSPQTSHQRQTLARICDTVLNECSSAVQLQSALKQFASLCSDISGIKADPGFHAWSEDAHLQAGVAINPQAAAHCVSDYQRSVIFIRALQAAIETLKYRFPGSPLKLLYAGCGPYATLLLPLLTRHQANTLHITLLDIHPQALNSVDTLLQQLGFDVFDINTVQADACTYHYPTEQGQVQLIISETMQKSLEQEPQFSVTANLAPQLQTGGVFIPERIEVKLALKNRHNNSHDVCQLMQLEASAASIAQALMPQDFTLPDKAQLAAFETPIELCEPVIYTRLDVYQNYTLEHHNAEITLPAPCPDLKPLQAGQHFRVAYIVSSYPRFEFERIETL
jgi:hypothetical protein